MQRDTQTYEATFVIFSVREKFLQPRLFLLLGLVSFCKHVDLYLFIYLFITRYAWWLIRLKYLAFVVSG